MKRDALRSSQLWLPWRTEATMLGTDPPTGELGPSGPHGSDPPELASVEPSGEGNSHTYA